MYRGERQTSVKTNNARDRQIPSAYVVQPKNEPTHQNISRKGSFQPLKSILSIKSMTSPNTNFSDSSTGTSEERRTHFDEKNIDLTYKPNLRDYGFIKITQTNTPFPRKTKASPPKSKQKQKHIISKLRNEESTRSTIITLPKPISSARFRAPQEMDFTAKRKIFNQGEFTLTRQRRPLQVHPPLKSIQLNTRPQTSCIALTEFFRKHYSQREQSPIYDIEQL